MGVPAFCAAPRPATTVCDRLRDRASAGKEGLPCERESPSRGEKRRKHETRAPSRRERGLTCKAPVGYHRARSTRRPTVRVNGRTHLRFCRFIAIALLSCP